MSKYRIKSWVGVSGTQYYAVQERRLLFWNSLRDHMQYLTLGEAKVAARYLSEVSGGSGRIWYVD